MDRIFKASLAITIAVWPMAATAQQLPANSVLGNPTAAQAPARGMDISKNFSGGKSVFSDTRVTCDGSADDTTGINAVLAGGATWVFIPQGYTCRTIAGLSVPAGVTFDWRGATIKKSGTGGQKVITIGGNGVTLYPGVFDGNSDSTFAGAGIFCQDKTNLVIDGGTFQNFAYENIYIVNCAPFTLMNAHLIGGDSVDGLGSVFFAPTSDVADVVFHNNFCDRNGSIAVGGQTCFNVVGDGSSIIRRFSFTNNRCVGVSSGGTLFQACLQNINTAQVDSMDGAIISNNQARYCNYCYTFDTLTSASVVGNTARDILSVGYTFEASNCVNTTFSGNAAEGTMNPAGSMALINLANGCVFIGNTFKNASVDAIAATINMTPNAPQAATNIISGNVVIASGGYGIVGSGNDSVISNNIVRGGVNCINLTGGTGRIVTGNGCFGQSGTPIVNYDATDFICNNTQLGCNPPKMRVAGGTPALTSCGTSPAIVGSDLTGEVTMGTAAPTGCVITFSVAYTSAPICSVTWAATPLASQSYAISSSAITLTQTATSSNKITYTCVARIGG